MQCNGNDCTPPEEPLFFTQTNNAFCEEFLPLVKNAKLELPVGSSDSLSPQHFRFQESYWGDHHSYPYAHQYASSEPDSYIYDVNNDYEYNQYHYPPQNYDEGWDSYNYEEEAHSAAYVPAEKIRVTNLMKIITQVKAYCVKKTQKTPSSVTTSINDMRTR